MCKHQWDISSICCHVIMLKRIIQNSRPRSHYSVFEQKRICLAPFLALRSHKSTPETELNENDDKNGAK